MASEIEVKRLQVEVLQRDLQIAQAELRLLEIAHENETIAETLEKLKGLRSDVQTKLAAQKEN